MVRNFNGMLFLGMGDRSMSKVDLLHERLNCAISLLSGLQQGGEDIDGKYNKELKDIVKDIAAAILGKEIEIGKDLPYPPIEKGD